MAPYPEPRGTPRKHRDARLLWGRSGAGAGPGLFLARPQAGQFPVARRKGAPGPCSRSCCSPFSSRSIHSGAQGKFILASALLNDLQGGNQALPRLSEEGMCFNLGA